jgi:hypothetical protein
VLIVDAMDWNMSMNERAMRAYIYMVCIGNCFSRYELTRKSPTSLAGAGIAGLILIPLMMEIKS